MALSAVDEFRRQVAEARAKRDAFVETMRYAQRRIEEQDDLIEQLESGYRPRPGAFLRDTRDGRLCVAVDVQGELQADYYDNGGRKVPDSWLHFDLVYQAGGPSDEELHAALGRR